MTDTDSSDSPPSSSDVDSRESSPSSDVDSGALFSAYEARGNQIAFTYDTPYTTDMVMTDGDPQRNDALFERKKKAARTLSSSSSPSEIKLKTGSLSPYPTSSKNTSQNYNKCAVVWCTEKTRKQFDKLFFINFPRDKKTICEVWWKICGRCDTYNPLLKICSIHFKATDFTTQMVRKNGKLYRESVLKSSYIIPSLYLQSHEYTTFMKNPKSHVKEIRQIPKKPKTIYVCVIQGCKKTSDKDGKSTLFFQFPLKNALLLKKWLKVIGLPFWKPLKTNRICSDHFENYNITKINNVYRLIKGAIPIIKPKNFFVYNHGGSSKIQFQKPVNNHLNSCDFGRLEFNVVDNNTLVVEETKKKNANNENSDILYSLNNELDQKLKDYEKTTLPNSTVRNNSTTTLSKSTVIKSSDKEKPLLISSPKINESNVQVISDDSNEIQESQSKDKTTSSLTKQYLESFEKEIAKERQIITGDPNKPNNIEFEYVYMDIINDVNMNAGVIEVQPSCNTNNSLKEKEVMEKSANNIDIDLDYVYMGMLNDENIMEVQPIFGADISVKDACDNTGIGFETKDNSKKIIAEPKKKKIFKGLGFETKNNSKKIIAEPKKKKIFKGVCDNNTGIQFETHHNSKKIIAVPTKKNTFKGVCDNSGIGFDTKNSLKRIIAERTNNNTVKETPQSIIYDQDLIECYGEMHPPYCDSNCQLKCCKYVPGPLRSQIFQQFHTLPNVTEQNCEIAQLVQVIMVENAYGNFERCPNYYLKTDRESVNVCRTFFMNTLGIPERRLDAVLKPLNYTWFTNKVTAFKANLPKQAKIITEQMIVTDFMKASLEPLKKDYNLFEPESDTEVTLENLSSKEREKVLCFIKSVPRIVCVPQVPGISNNTKFETRISVGHMYKTYSKCYMVSPPCTKQQFIKIYNQYMKSHLKMV